MSTKRQQGGEASPDPIFLSPALEGSPGPGLDNPERFYQSFLDSTRNRIEPLPGSEAEMRKLLGVTERINRGLSLEEILQFVYEELRSLVPFNRLGFALIDEKENRVISRWVRSDRPINLGVGFKAPLAGSTLEHIMQTGSPRILNDLPGYLAQKPRSKSTHLIVGEGMRSSLTCPLVVRGRPVGFIFFSSERDGVYSSAHVEFLQQIAGQLSVIVEKGRLYTDLAEQAAVIEQQNLRLTKELEMARRLQRAFIPQQPPDLPGLAMAFLYEPALQVGGDILDILPLAGGRALVFTGDAMGHGVEAAMLMAATKTSFHTAARLTSDPAQILRRINRELSDLIGDRFVTALCVRLDPAAGLADVALAGHVHPLHWVARTGDILRPGDAGLPLGVRAEEGYPCARCRFELGDVLVCYTDGITEAPNLRGEPYGDERLALQVRCHGSVSAGSLLGTIETGLKSHCQRATRKDDLTILIVKATGQNG